MYGITAYHIRLLTDNPISFSDVVGCGMSLKDVAELTPDQVYFKLCNRDILRKGSKLGPKGKPLPTGQLYSFADEKGFVKGRDAKGNLIKLPILKDGKTKTQLIREKIAAQKRAENGN